MNWLFIVIEALNNFSAINLILCFQVYSVVLAWNSF